MRMYKYVGSDEVRASAVGFPIGTRIQSIDNLKAWINKTSQQPDAWGLIPATFVVDAECYLRIADRHSEHIACAGGASIMAAGEIFFSYDNQKPEVIEVSNQSTGYCPEPESWEFVASALDKIQLCHPGRFTTEFVFRRCPICGQLNIVKDDLFLCAVCNSDLPATWNCDYQLT